MMKIKKNLLLPTFFSFFIHNAWAMDLDEKKDNNFSHKHPEQENDSFDPRDILKSSGRLEALKDLFHIPKKFKPDVLESGPSYHLKIELNILNKMIGSLEDFIYIFATNTINSKLIICVRNHFIEYAARYMLYDESTLGYDDEPEKHNVFEAFDVIQKLCPSLSLDKCLTAPLDRLGSNYGLYIHATPPLGFSSIYHILLLMNQSKNSSFHENIPDLNIYLKDLKRLRDYFGINEHLRVILPLIESIENFRVTSHSTDISQFENLCVINEKIPYELQKVDSKQIERAQKSSADSNNGQHIQDLRKLAYGVVPWIDLRNLGLIMLHSSSPLFPDVLFLPHNEGILLNSLPMIVEEFKQLIPLIEQLIVIEIRAALEIPTTLAESKFPSFPSITLLSKYGADTAYLHKIKKVFQGIDFTSDHPIPAILRLIEILGETSKNISPALKASNKTFWESLESIRDSGQHGISFQRKLITTLTNKTELIPLLLKDFEETLHFAQEAMSNPPQKWEDLKNFYRTPYCGPKIEGNGIKKLIELVNPFSLTAEDYAELRNTINSYKEVEKYRLLVENTLEGKNLIKDISQKEFFSHVDALSALSKKSKDKLKEAYKTLRKKGSLGESQDKRNQKIENLKALLKDFKNLSSQELSDIINELIQKIRTYRNFSSLQKKLEEIGISDIETWREKWGKTQKNPSNSRRKKNENTEHNKVKIINDSVGASGEIIKHFNKVNQLLGGCSQGRSKFLDDYKIRLSVEHHLTMIRHYVGVIHEAHKYMKRHDIADPFYTALSEFCWILEAKLKNLCLMGNSLAHLHDVTHSDAIKIGEYGWNYMNFSNIILYLDGRSCDCINCRDLPPSAYKTSVVEELAIYKEMMERMLNH